MSLSAYLLSVCVVGVVAVELSPYAIRMARADRARLRFLPTRDSAFIEPMECLAVVKLPQGA